MPDTEQPTPIAPAAQPSTPTPAPVGASTITATDTRVTATKGLYQIIAETLIDLVALGIIGAALLLERIHSEWLQGVAIAAMLLLAGVRVSDLVALSRGLPGRGGPTALVLAAAGALAARYVGGGA